MNENPESNGQFKMRLDDEIEASAIASHVDELRIEKLNQRMTLITILIPVLIVVVLVMAYMDIKRRVVQTEDTGQLTAQTLAENLESRFSNLSMGQALIEEKINHFTDQTNQTVAKIQVNLKNLEDSLKKSRKSMASQKDVRAAVNQMGRDLGNVAQTAEAVNAQMASLSEAMQSRLDQLGQTTAENQSHTRQLEAQILAVEQDKPDKAALDLAFKLEILKLKQHLKAQMDDIKSQLQALETRIEQQAARTVTKPAAPAPAPSPQPSPAGAIKEQTIRQ